jgi:hypothetical protein
MMASLKMSIGSSLWQNHVFFASGKLHFKHVIIATKNNDDDVAKKI